MMINQHTRPQHTTTALNHSTQPQHPTTTSNHNIKPQHLTSTPNQHPTTTLVHTRPPHPTPTPNPNTQPEHPTPTPDHKPDHPTRPHRPPRRTGASLAPSPPSMRCGTSRRREAGGAAGWAEGWVAASALSRDSTSCRGGRRHSLARRCSKHSTLSGACPVVLSLYCVVLRRVTLLFVLCCVVWCGVVCHSVLCCLTPRASPRRRGREMDAALDSLRHESSSALKQPSEALKQRIATPPDGHDDHTTQHAQHARVQQGAATPVRGPSAAYNWESSGRAVEQ